MIIHFCRPVISNRQTICFDVDLSGLSSKGKHEQMVSPGNVIKIVFKHLCPSFIYHPLVYKCSDQLVSASNATHFNTICNIITWGDLSSESGGEIFVGRVVLERDFRWASCLGATCLWSELSCFHWRVYSHTQCFSRLACSYVRKIKRDRLYTKSVPLFSWGELSWSDIFVGRVVLGLFAFGATCLVSIGVCTVTHNVLVGLLVPM